MRMYRVKVVRFASGERFPALTDGVGVPLFAPTLFAVTELGMRNLASNTVSNALRSLQPLMPFLDRAHADLIERFKVGAVLTLNEVGALTQRCGRLLEAIFREARPSLRAAGHIPACEVWNGSEVACGVKRVRLSTPR